MPRYSNEWLEIPCPYTGEVVEVPPGHAARLAGVTRQTARRWLSSGIPPLCLKMLQVRVHGLLPDPAWHRFRFRGGRLVSLDGSLAFEPDQLERAWVTWQQNSALRLELDRIRRPPERVLQLVPGKKKPAEAGKRGVVLSADYSSLK